MTSLIMIVVSSALVSNVVLSQFLGICSFLGVSRQIKTSASLGGAVIFVITIASAVASLLYDYVMVPLNLDSVSYTHLNRETGECTWYDRSFHCGCERRAVYAG